ncbi:hypothetical protein J6590_009661 [Homalodisca vitripennis]|nr:hypothetical protein J6590_009661 [Homalodisca vitripennis]
MRNVAGLPQVRPMGEVSAVAGESLVIACPVAGYPIHTIKWFRGDRVLPLNRRQLVFPNGTLIVDKVQAGADGDGGAYRCTAADKLGRSASGTVHVKVMVPPKITPFSFRSDLLLGERVGVQCVISKGDPPLTIQWQKDGLELTVATSGDGGPSGGSIIVRDLDDFTSILSIGALARHHGGNYTCLASNSVARAHHTASLSVNGPTLPDVRIPIPHPPYPGNTDTLMPIPVNLPPAITPFSFGELSLGERVRVTCSVKRGDPPVTINWFKDSHPLDSESFPDSDLTIIRDLEDFSSVLAIPHVDSRHSGNYTCMASNPAKRALYTATLLVTAVTACSAFTQDSSARRHSFVRLPPTWVVEPQNKAAKLGQPAILDCKVEGFPQPTVLWKKVSGEVLGHYRDISTGVLANGSLLIESVRQEDQGQYLCEASNGIGEGLSSVVTLTVNAPVHFKVRSKKELVRRGGIAALQCTAHGDLPITLSWRKEGSFIDLGGRISMKNSTVPGGLVSELSVRNVRTDDSGVYTCIGRNHFGQDQTTLHLLVQDAPGKPFNVRLVDQSSRQVQLSWAPPQDGNSPITRYIIRYAPLQAIGKGDPKTLLAYISLSMLDTVEMPLEWMLTSTLAGAVKEASEL